MEIHLDDLTGSSTASFIEEHLEEMRAASPPESKHALDLDGLRAVEVRFWTVHEEGSVVGCGAVKLLDERIGEVKAMRVAPEFRRRGVASMLLAHIINEAREMGITQLFLETGSSEFFEPARRLYVGHGFDYCDPFGDYMLDPNSVFMTKCVA